MTKPAARFNKPCSNCDRSRTSCLIPREENRLQQLNALIGLYMIDHAPQTLQTAQQWILQGRTDEDNAELANAEIRLAIVEARWLRQNSAAPAAATQLKRLESSAHRLLQEHTDPRHHHLYATLLHELGLAEQDAKQFVAASSSFQRLAQLQTTAMERGEVRVDQLEARAQASAYQGNNLILARQNAAAIACFEQAVLDYQSAWQMLYGDAYYTQNLSIALANLAQANANEGQTQTAIEQRRESVDWLRQVIAVQGAAPEHIHQMARCYLQLAELLEREHSERAELMGQARILIDHLLEQAPLDEQLEALDRRWHQAEKASDR